MNHFCQFRVCIRKSDLSSKTTGYAYIIPSKNVTTITQLEKNTVRITIQIDPKSKRTMYSRNNLDEVKQFVATGSWMDGGGKKWECMDVFTPSPPTITTSSITERDLCGYIILAVVGIFATMVIVQINYK